MGHGGLWTAWTAASWRRIGESAENVDVGLNIGYDRRSYEDDRGRELNSYKSE